MAADTAAGTAPVRSPWRKGKVIRWGVIGCGQIAVDKTIPGLLAAAGARLVAVADVLRERRLLALGLAAKAGIDKVRAYPDATSLFADPEIDAVYIALPTGLHAEAVLAAAQAGKAILCEKPLGRSSSEVAEMVRAARKHGVPLMTGYMSRFSDPFRKAVELVQGGAIGQVTYIDAHFSYCCLNAYPPGSPGGWRWTDPLGGGPLLDIGIYLAFGIREILGERIAEVWPMNCDTVAPAGSVVRDSTLACFRTERGTPGTFVTTFTHSASVISFHGTEGMLILDQAFRQTPGASLVCRSRDTDLMIDTRNDDRLPHFDNYRREFEHFSVALLTGGPWSPAPEEVVADALLLDALRRNLPGLTVPAVDGASAHLSHAS